MDFLREFERLRATAPRLALRINSCTNSDYTNYPHGNKNCYLVSGAAENQDCYYSTTMINCRDTIDSYAVWDCELVYEGVNCEKCYNCSFIQACKGVRDCFFCFDCVGCEFCFGCVSQRNKKYMMFNEQLSKEKYEEKIKYFLSPDHIEEARQKFLALQLSMPRIFARQVNCENVVGDYLTNCQNCFMCFDGKESQDGMYLDRPIQVKDSIDCSHLYQHCELNYMLMSATQSVNVNFSFAMDFCHDCEYSMYCFNSHHLFGCIARNHAEYQILNQPYEKEEWFKKVAEIKWQMRQTGGYGKMIGSDFPLEDTLATGW